MDSAITICLPKFLWGHKKLEPNEINLSQKVSTFNSLPAMSADNSFANSLDPEQTRQNVGPDLDPNCLTPGWY